MATTNISNLVEEVHAELPGCPPALILKSARRVIHDFCMWTQAYEYDLDPIYVTADETDYELDLDSDEVAIERVVKVVLDDAELSPALDYEMLDKTTLRLVAAPTEDIDAGLEVRVCLRPSRTATTIDERFYDDWYRYWAFGVLAELMRQPAKPWTNLELSAYYENEFRKGVNTARIEHNKGMMNRSIGVYRIPLV